jgi:adenylate cyclase class IV
MPRNIEIKARVADAAELHRRAQALATAPEERLVQDDSFFALPAGRGRLKLRQFGDGSAELIHYQRADEAGAKASDYVRVPQPDGDACREALTRALGLVGRVRKRRTLLMVGRTRIHLDAVEGLGDYMELEVVLRDGEPDAAGSAEAEALMQALGLAKAPRLAGAYLDLLLANEPSRLAAP